VCGAGVTALDHTQSYRWILIIGARNRIFTAARV
jgi:hypothetical protein